MVFAIFGGGTDMGTDGELSFLKFWDWVDKVTVQFPRSFFFFFSKPLVSVSNRNR